MACAGNGGDGFGEEWWREHSGKKQEKSDEPKKEKTAIATVEPDASTAQASRSLQNHHRDSQEEREAEEELGACVAMATAECGLQGKEGGVPCQTEEMADADDSMTFTCPECQHCYRTSDLSGSQADAQIEMRRPSSVSDALHSVSHSESSSRSDLNSSNQEVRQPECSALAQIPLPGGGGCGNEAGRLEENPPESPPLEGNAAGQDHRQQQAPVDARRDSWDAVRESLFELAAFYNIANIAGTFLGTGAVGTGQKALNQGTEKCQEAPEVDSADGLQENVPAGNTSSEDSGNAGISCCSAGQDVEGRDECQHSRMCRRTDDESERIPPLSNSNLEDRHENDAKSSHELGTRYCPSSDRRQNVLCSSGEETPDRVTERLEEGTSNRGNSLSILDLPSELFRKVYQMLSFSDLMQGWLVSRGWREALKVHSLWKCVSLEGNAKSPLTSSALIASCRRAVEVTGNAVEELDLCEHHSQEVPVTLTRSAVALAFDLCSNITTLRISFTVLPRDCYDLIGEKLHHLQTLGLYSCKHVSDEHIAKIAEHGEDLRVISLNGCSSLSDHGVATLVSKAKKLTRLSLHQVTEVSGETIQALMDNCPDLEVLSLVMNSVDGQHLEDIYQLKRLHMLMLSKLRGLNRYFVRNTLSRCSGLRELCVSLNTNIDDQCMEIITLAIPRLTKLSIVGCTVSDRGMECIGDRLKDLKNLDAAWCKEVTMAGARAVCEGCEHLSELGLMRCDRISLPEAKALKRDYPRLAISHLLLEADVLFRQAQLFLQLQQQQQQQLQQQ